MEISIEYVLWLLPVLAATSLVMAATRHEQMSLIWRQATRTAAVTLLFLLIIAAVVGLATYWIG